MRSGPRQRTERAHARPPQAHARHHRNGRARLRAAGGHARRDWRNHRPAPAAQRHPRGANARAAGRVRHDLRKQAERDHRGGGAVHQKRQRLHPARRQRSPGVLPGAGRPVRAGAGRKRPARARRAAGAHGRSRRRGRAHCHAAIRGRHHPARRPQPDRAHQRRSQSARHQAPGRRVPHLRGRAVRRRPGPESGRQRQNPEIQPLQRHRNAAGGPWRGRALSAAHGRHLRGQRRAHALRRRKPGAA